MNSEELQELKKVFKGDIASDPTTLGTYSRDASLFEMRPTMVTYPRDSADVQTLVRFVAEHKKDDPTLSLTARAAGTDMSGGAINESIIMDTTRYMHGVIEINASEKWARVLPGTYYRDFDAATRKEGLIMPTYPASRDLCTVGGMVANNSGGEKSMHYGKTENFIRSLKVVFRDGYEYTVRPLARKELMAKIAEVGFEGEMYRTLYKLITENAKMIADAKPNVSKNSAGYYLWNVWDPTTDTFDLCRLIVGSQGTLCIVTEITFNLVPIKKFSTLCVVFLKDMEDIGAIVNSARAQHPESIESYDDNTLKVAVKFFGDFLRKKKVVGMVQFMFSFLPEFFMTLAGGIPKMILLIEFAGDSHEAIQQQAHSLARAIKEQFHVLTHVTRSEVEESKYWDVRHESFNLLRKHVQGKHTAPFIDDFIVRPEVLPEFLPKLDAILKKYDLVYTIAGHPGDGNFHIIPLMNLKDPRTRDIILTLSDQVYDLVLQYHGSITAEHNDGLIRSPYLEKQYGPIITELFKETKHIFDPDNLFNPHKKVGVSKDDIAKYLSKGDYGEATSK
ncbi:MAG TPA: FAD-binding oxidoreductase [Candidatus Paceibacterota bacterium]|nr:FAD-binding oxidoreductase [Candidatus Paceibacterota bacterium]